MGLFKRKSNPLEERTHALNREIAELEARIKKLSEQQASGTPPSVSASEIVAPPPVRPTSTPHTVGSPTTAPSKQPRYQSNVPSRRQPVLEPGQPVPEVMYNTLGGRKYDLPAAWGWIASVFKGSSPSNPHLVKYLANGGLPGMRALRFEKRVARRRFVFLVIGLTLFLWVILAALLNHR